MRKLYILGLIALAATIIGLAWAEQMTFSTYYPAPYGVYRQFTTTGKTTLATDIYGTETDANVGIGTTNPSGILHVDGGTSASDDGRDITLQAEGGDPGFNKDGGNIILLPGAGGGTGADGNVGIGTTSPQVPLHIQHTEFPTGCAIRMTRAIREWDIDVTDQGSFTIGDNTVATDRLVIDTSGNVGIGAPSPASKFEIKQAGTGSEDGLRITSSSGVNDSRQIYVDSSNNLAFRWAATGQCPSLSSAGAWINAPSFSWLKQDRDVISKDETLDILSSTNIEKFEQKSKVKKHGNEAETDIDIGIVLDEAHSSLATKNEKGEIIGYSPMRTASVAFRGVQISLEEINELKAVLTKAIQELKLENDSLKKKIFVLETKIK